MKNSVAKFLSLAAAVCLLAGVARADSLQDGNAAFAKGDFTAAARAYEAAVSAGPASAGLYYNLGTAQAKAGQRPQAALSFRRALMLDPGMADARVSLSDVERSENVPVVAESWKTRLAEKANLTTLLVAGSVLFWIGAFIFLPVLFGKRTGFVPVAGAAILLLVGAALFVAGALADPKVADRRGGVVVADQEVLLRETPADQSTALTNLRPASRVTILGKSGDWTYCQAPAGERGWVPSGSVLPIVPTT